MTCYFCVFTVIYMKWSQIFFRYSEHFRDILIEIKFEIFRIKKLGISGNIFRRFFVIFVHRPSSPLLLLKLPISYPHATIFSATHSKQCGNNGATLCCAKNRRCDFNLSHVASPLRWCYTERFATTIFSATQRCNFGEQRCNHSKQCGNDGAMLCCAKKSSLRIVSYILNITFRPSI